MCITYKTIHGQAPIYLEELITKRHTSHTLRGQTKGKIYLHQPFGIMRTDLIKSVRHLSGMPFQSIFKLLALLLHLSLDLNCTFLKSIIMFYNSITVSFLRAFSTFYNFSSVRFLLKRFLLCSALRCFSCKSRYKC